MLDRRLLLRYVPSVKRVRPEYAGVSELMLVIVKNHGVPLQTVNNTFKHSHDFFALPMETKREIDVSKSDNFRGWMGLLSENNDPTKKGELHEAFNLGLDPSLGVGAHADKEDIVEGALKHSDNLWPAEKQWDQAEAFVRPTSPC